MPTVAITPTDLQRADFAHRLGSAALHDSLGADRGARRDRPAALSEATYRLVDGASRRIRRCTHLIASRHGMKTA
jgi:hypothetical protein